MTGVEGSIANDAACTWQRSWLTAYQQADQAEMSAAMEGLDQTAGLKIMSQVNNAESLAELAGDAKESNAAPIQNNVALNCPVSFK